MVVLGALLLLAGCGKGAADPSSAEGKGGQKGGDDTYKVGIAQYVIHSSLDEATKGFKQALADAGLKVEYDTQIANAEPGLTTTIAENFANSDVDLIFANATPSAQAAAGKTKDKPVVFTSVTDAVGAGLIDSMEKPGGNVTGTVDAHPDAIKNSLDFMKDELKAKNIGMVYNSGEQNSRAQVEIVKKMASGMGMKIVDASVATSADVKQATESLIGKADCIYIITDNTVVSALDSVLSVAAEQKLPVMVGELDSVRNGGLAAYGFEYFDIGYEAGEMAVKILKGEAKPSDIPAQYPQKLKLMVNKKVADSLGLQIGDGWDAEYFE